MELPPLTALAFCLVISTGGSQGFTVEAAQSDLYVPIGGYALFTVRPSNAIENGTWDFKSKRIVQWLGTALVIHPEYTSRVDLNFNSGSLVLRSVNQSDNGVYTVSLTEVGNTARNSATITLHPLEPVEHVTLRSNNSELVEQRDSVVMTCSSQGTQLKWEWLLNNQRIRQNNRIKISGDTLRINPVNRADTGMYKCIVSNGLNNDSDETSLVVFYGPENIRILPPLPVVAIVGSSLTLTCLALSEPGEYRWLKGNRWLQNGQEYTFDSVSSANRGNYTCLVTNYITKRNIRLAFQVTPTAAVTPGLTLGAVVGIVVGLIAAGLIGGVGGWLIVRKTSGLKAEPGTKYDTNRSPSGQTTSATAAGNGQATYENLSGNTEQGINRAPEGDPTYMGLKMDERSVYSELRR